jgi:hypothetical protein
MAHAAQNETMPRPTLATSRSLSPVAPTHEEAAAIVAALERFMRATAPPPRARADAPDPWRQAAILEGISRDPHGGVPDPWINT